MDISKEGGEKLTDEYGDMCNFTLEKSEAIVIDDLDNENLWAAFGKSLQDFTMRDMTKLIFRYLYLYSRFHEMYAKPKGFGIR